MSTTNEISDGKLPASIEGLTELPPEQFLSSIKELSSETIGEMQKLGSLSEDQLSAIDVHLKTSANPAKKTSTKRNKPSGNDGYLPLRERLNAWWRGDDVTFNKTKSRIGPKKGIILPQDSDPRRWTPNSIRMSQELWGEGFVEPGGAVFAKKLLSPFKYDSSNSMLDLSAGVGGTAAIMAKEHNMWMDAYEPNEELTVAGNSFLARIGQSSKVPLKHVDLETLELPEKKYDQIYSRNALFLVENKKNVVQQIGQSLKNRGQVIIVDFMLADQSKPSDLAQWQSAERSKPHLWTSDLYQNAFSHYGMSVWSINDFSQEYLAEIHQGWQMIISRINSGNFDRKFVNHLLREGEIWMGRIQALESGALTVKRIHAVV